VAANGAGAIQDALFPLVAELVEVRLQIPALCQSSGAGLLPIPAVTAGPPYVGWSLLIHIFLPVEMQLSRPLSTVTNNRTNCLSYPYAERP
jgi:hypothetical protein